VEILEKNCATGSGYTWHKILYNGTVGYVVAGNNTPNFTFETSWVALVNGESSSENDTISQKEKIYAATVYAEAGGQNYRTKQAVANVMNNRIGTRSGWTDIEAVVSAPYQFSGYGNAMYNEAINYYDSGNHYNTTEKYAMDECMKVIRPIYSGTATDITGGALYFHSYPNAEDWTYHNDYTLIEVAGTEGFWFYK